MSRLRRTARPGLLTIAAALLSLVGTIAAAQDRPTSVGSDSAPHVSGWLFTPTLIYAGGYDDNVLLHDQGDATTGDFLTVVNPRGQLDYTARHAQFTVNYDGAFLLYHNLNTLNSYDQHGSLMFQDQLSRRVTLFVTDTAAIVPTTAAVEFFGVPFVRTGSRLDELRGGLQFAVSKRTSLTATYIAEWVGFDRTADPNNVFLQGGHSQGIAADLKHQLSSRLAFISDFNMQHGNIGAGVDSFDVRNALAGVEYQLSDVTRVSAAAGISWLGVTSFGPARTGPAVRAGLTRQLHKAALDLGYSRSFVPSYGFGGTMQNEEATARVRTPLGRRVSAQSSVAWRRDQTLTVGELSLSLTSWWFDAAIGYALTPWLRIEGVYDGARQTIDRPGGTLDRNHIGFQFVMTQPIRIQ